MENFRTQSSAQFEPPPSKRGGIAIFKNVKKGGDGEFFLKRGGMAKRGGCLRRGGMANFFCYASKNRKIFACGGLEFTNIVVDLYSR